MAGTYGGMVLATSFGTVAFIVIALVVFFGIAILGRPFIVNDTRRWRRWSTPTGGISTPEDPEFEKPRDEPELL